ncbi:hypothetical protein ACHAXR_007455 [Thalassiosira sp. AJA248-18]
MCKSQPSNSSKEGEVTGSNSVGPSTSGDVKNDASDGNQDSPSNNTEDAKSTIAPLSSASSSLSIISTSTPQLRRRRKRDRQKAWSKLSSISNITTTTSTRIIKKKKRSKLATKHADDSKSGGMDALIPSAIGVVVLIFVVMARLGFRGRATVAGIDLGTTNSVICVQAPSKGVGEIECIIDPATNSPVVPSVVSFLDNHHLRSFRLTKEERGREWPELVPHPVDAVVGQAAKDRINSHPHHTVYHAKRIIGREYNHESVHSLKGEVDFGIVSKKDENNDIMAGAADAGATTSAAILSPSEIGSYIIHHLRTIARNHLQHDNVQSAVIAIPAKFDPSQRDATIRAFQLAGLKVARILEEPTAAALAYGLHKRDDVHYVMVYDFGGGTLDISLLYIGEGGYIDVLGSDGDEQLGGADFDAAVAHWLLEKKGGEEIVNVVMASVARIEDGLDGSLEDVADVEDLIEELCPKLEEVPLCTISSFHTIEYDLAVDQLYKRSILPIQRLLKDLDLQKEEIDEVVMVGGTTRMPQIRELVRVQMEKERLNTHIDPDLTVAYGAASVID